MNLIKEILETFQINNVVGEVNEEDLLKDTVTIRKSDLKKLGEDLMKEVDKFLNDEYIIKTFPEMILDRKEFDRSVKNLKEKNGSESLNMNDIYHILTKIRLDEEIDGDLFYKKKGYLHLFQVLFVDYRYLKD